MKRKRIVGYGLLILVLTAVWLILTGGAAWLVGVAVAITAAAITAWLLPTATAAERSRLVPIELVRFFVFFVVESVRGGLDVAYRALAPGLPIEPVWVRHTLGIRHPAARTLLVGVLSLLPGTLAARLNGDHVLIHCLSPETADGVTYLEKRIAALFGETDRLLEKSG